MDSYIPLVSEFRYVAPTQVAVVVSIIYHHMGTLSLVKGMQIKIVDGTYS